MPLAAGLDYLINVAEDIARRAANDPKKIVFTPPLGVFNNEEKAREEDLIAGLVLSVDCDQHPDEARETLRESSVPRPWQCAAAANGPTRDRPGSRQITFALAAVETGAHGALPELKRARELAARIVGGECRTFQSVHPIRWPGSWHRKADPVLCTIAAEDSDAEIDLAAALRVLEAAVSAQPQGNGLTLTRRINSRPTTASVPIGPN